MADTGDVKDGGPGLANGEDAQKPRGAICACCVFLSRTLVCTSSSFREIQETADQLLKDFTLCKFDIDVINGLYVCHVKLI